MILTPDSRSHAALDAAVQVVLVTARNVADRLLAPPGTGAGPVAVDRRLGGSSAQTLGRNLAAFQRVFRDTLAEQVRDTLAEPAPVPQRPPATNWQTLSLVDDRQVEERMECNRIGQQIADACEWEVREVGSHLASVLHPSAGEADGNPLRPVVIGTAVVRAAAAVAQPGTAQQTLAREFGAAMAEAMRDAYRKILHDLQARGIEAAGPTVRTVEGPGGHASGYATNYHSVSGVPSAGGGGGGGRGYEGGGHGADGRFASSHAGLAPGRAGGGSGGGGGGADAQLRTLLRRLTSLTQRPGPAEGYPAEAGHAPAGHAPPARGGGWHPMHDTGAWSPASAPLAYPSTPFGATNTPMSSGGTAPVNLIRAHRDELMQATPGRLDHLVIDVVGSLFDQVLSDPRVPPQMARQIARLQLPVLRVALNDSTFFSSRRHPVRRFVNRIASLALAFDDFSEGAGRQFLERVRALVQEIVEGDFDQIELYARKLESLEQFIGQQTQGQVEGTAAAATLEGKETELRLQQRYALQLQTALGAAPVEPWLREFLAQVWSQALLQVHRADGPTADRSVRFRRAARELVMSVLPKGSPMLRARFLVQLPPLMKDLGEGLALIGWPESAKKAFLARLRPAQSASLKQPPMSELDYNMMAKQVEAMFAAHVPGAESVSYAEPVPEAAAEQLEKRFTPEDADQVHLLAESAVDWDGKVDVDLSAPVIAAADAADTAAATELAAHSTTSGLDVNLDLASTEAPEPVHGRDLFEHIRLGFAYRMHLKDQWQKVRLTYVSPGRSFFVFSHGRRHQETISMTARMLTRMCETGRMRAIEPAALLERATQRARHQLARLKTQPAQL